MELSLEHPGQHLFIRSHGPEGIRVIDAWHSPPLLMSPERLAGDWKTDRVEDIDNHAIDQIVDMGCEIVLIGCGARQTFLSAEQMVAFYSKGLGVEIMTTDAACRTFNVLASEGRSVAVAILALAAPQ